jgi:hypothetical protein
MLHKYRLPVAVIAALALGACADVPDATGPEMVGPGFNAAVVPNQSQLQSWFEHASPAALAVAGAIFADNDEVSNRLVFGVERGNGNARKGVETALVRLGIPQSAIEIVDADPIYQLASLRDVFRPTVAGIQIHFGQYVCSIGFNATIGTTRYMVTASHCTNRQGGVEGTQYYQPLSSTNSTVIATEDADPAYFKGNGCPPGRKCRYSDASRALYSASVASNRGEIAKTTGVNNGSLTTSGVFTVTSQADVTSGTVNKVGRTTGWTQGTITRTCVDTGVQGSNIVQLCQTFVESGSVIVGGGDSGSSMFQLSSGDNVKLVGQLWGGSSDGKLIVYSPISAVLAELGALNGVK